MYYRGIQKEDLVDRDNFDESIVIHMYHRGTQKEDLVE